jgi:hypothetical protein
VTTTHQGQRVKLEHLDTVAFSRTSENPSTLAKIIRQGALSFDAETIKHIHTGLSIIAGPHNSRREALDARGRFFNGVDTPSLHSLVLCHVNGGPTTLHLSAG